MISEVARAKVLAVDRPIFSREFAMRLNSESIIYRHFFEVSRNTMEEIYYDQNELRERYLATFKERPNNIQIATRNKYSKERQVDTLKKRVFRQRRG